MERLRPRTWTGTNSWWGFQLLSFFEALSPPSCQPVTAGAYHMFTCTQDLLIRITTPPESVVKGDVVERALKVVLDSLDQTIIDVPFASTLVSFFCTLLVQEGARACCGSGARA